jgi:hypothetical protein
MHNRNSESIVTFRHPFTIDAALSDQPAGSYRVTKEEELIEGISYPTYRLISSALQIPAIGVPSLTKQFVAIADADLKAALERDELGVNKGQASRIDDALSIADHEALAPTKEGFMSSTSREFFTPDDLRMLDRVLVYTGYPQADDICRREARLEASRFLITAFQSGVTTERELRGLLADRGVIEVPQVGQTGQDLPAQSPSASSQPRYPGGGYQYGKRVETNGKWTVYHVFTGVPAQFGAWEMVELNAKTAERALKILNSPTKAEGPTDDVSATSLVVLAGNPSNVN